MIDNKLSERQYNAALYMRLSRDDDDDKSESASITTQRKMLRAYAEENGYAIYDEYIDDGVSGTTFDRLNFNRMIQDIEAKKVNMVITKDLSRLGRDYIVAGQYTEIYFPSKNIRYIAINDNYDSNELNNDIVPFKNILNEMIARDTSKKIRSAFITRMKDGEFISSFPDYGYKRDPDNPHHLIPDEEVSGIVYEIFKSHKTDRAMAKELEERHIPTPLVYRCSKNSKYNIDKYNTQKKWTAGTIRKIRRNRKYLGHLVQGKTSKVSFKSKGIIKKAEEDWIVVENTHEPLIDQETFDLQGRMGKQRTCTKKGNHSNIFSNIVKCADCGRNMSSVGTRKKNAVANLACGNYKFYGASKCSNHFIDYTALYNIVLSSIKEMITLTKKEEEEIYTEVLNQFQKKNRNDGNTEKLAQMNKRIREIDSLIERLYEDNIQGILSAERMKKLLAKYEAENENISKRLELLDKEKTENKADKFLELKKILENYKNINELTPDLLIKLIDRIEIGQGIYEKTDKGKIKNQTVKIFYRFTGKPVIKHIKL